jgi:hypothetical protein
MNAEIHSKLSRGVRAVAIFEALKGIIVLCAGFGLFSLVHKFTSFWHSFECVFA